ncbi:MAG: hypothetical protein ACREE2_06200 [Stellaceae bacterium]
MRGSRRAGIAGVGALILVAVTAPFSYLARDINDIVTIDHSSQGLTEQGQATIAHIACEGFTQLLQDPQLRPTIDTALEKMRGHPAAALAVLRNMEQFKAEFLTAEAQRLAAFGLGAQAIHDTLFELNRVAVTERQRNSPRLRIIAAQEIIANLGYLKDAACKLDTTDLRGMDAARRERLMHNLGLGVLGTGVVVADTLGSEVPVVPELSVELGYEMLVEALTVFR